MTRPARHTTFRSARSSLRDAGWRCRLRFRARECGRRTHPQGAGLLARLHRANRGAFTLLRVGFVHRCGTQGMGLRSVFSGAESEVGWPDRRRGRGKRAAIRTKFPRTSFRNPEHQEPSVWNSQFQIRSYPPYQSLTNSNIIFKISTGTHI